MAHGAGHYGLDHDTSDSSSKRIAIFITIRRLSLSAPFPGTALCKIVA